MLQSSELRVGNSIQCKADNGDITYNTVKGIWPLYDGGFEVMVGENDIWHNTHISGIPLTEELLLKMGLEYRFDQYHFEVDAADYIIEQQDDWFFIGIKSGKSIVYFVWYLYYLHELQNALYMLGKKELTLS